MTVVIITRNRCQELSATLAKLCAMPERSPVVVVDNGSTDETVAVAQSFPRVRVLAVGSNLGAAGRVRGAQEAKTPHVVFADDDVHWQPGCLSRAADLLDAYPRVGLLVAKVLVGPDGMLDPICTEMANSPIPPTSDAAGPRLIGFLAGVSVARREAFLEAAEGIPAGLLIGGEEEWIAAEMLSRGWRICYAADLVVNHYPSAVRDATGRRHLILRNALWFAWLRRPLASVVRRTMEIGLASCGDASDARAFFRALAAVPLLCRKRRVVADEVEQMFRLLEQEKRASRSLPALQSNLAEAPCSMTPPSP